MQRSLNTAGASGTAGWPTPGSGRVRAFLEATEELPRVPKITAAAASAAGAATATSPTAAKGATFAAVAAQMGPAAAGVRSSSSSSSAEFYPAEQQENIFSFLQHIVHQQPRHRRDFLLVEASHVGAAAVAAGAGAAACAVAGGAC